MSEPPAQAKPVAAPSASKTTKVKAAERRKIEARPNPAPEQDKAAAAAAVSIDSKPNAPPPADGSGSNLAPAAAVEAPKPAPVVPASRVDVNAVSVPASERHMAWIPITGLALIVVSAIAFVARRRKDDDISILDHGDGSGRPPVQPMPRHS